MNACDRCREELGGYILGGITDDEAASVEEHLASCAACRVQHAELAHVPGLLDVVRSAPPQVPARVRDRLMAAAERDRARRTWFRITAAAALAAAVVGGLVGWEVASSDPPGIAIALEAVESQDASGWATFTDHGGEVAVHLEIEGLEPLESPNVYEAWLATEDRRIMSIGLLDDIDGRSVITLTAEGGLDDFRSFWLTAEPDARDPAHQGPTVVRAPVPEIR